MAISYEDNGKCLWVAVRSALDACRFYGGSQYPVYGLISISLAFPDLKDHEAALRGQASRPHCTILWRNPAFPLR